MSHPTPPPEPTRLQGTSPRDPAEQDAGAPPQQPVSDPAGAPYRTDTPGPAPYQAPSPAPLAPQDERTWAIAAHLSSFVAAYLALGFLGPLVVMLVAGPRSAYVRRHAVEALNFNLTALIYIAVSVLLMIVLIGFATLVAVGILYLVAVILGALAAGRGEEYRDPFTIRFVH